MRLALVLVALFATGELSQAPAPEPFTRHRFTARDGSVLPYRLLSPATTSPDRRYPLVVQLHGSGAFGTDNEAQIGGFSNGWLQPDIRERFPAFVLVPQFPARTVEYPEGRSPLRSQPTPWLSAAYELIDAVVTDLHIDRSRLYIVGFSMGASSALQAIVTRTDMFAAAMAIAPVPPDNAIVPSTPLLILHGDRDTENPFTVSRAWFNEQRSRKGAAMEMKVYPGLEHQIPPDVPTGSWWREWLFSKRLRPSHLR